MTSKQNNSEALIVEYFATADPAEARIVWRMVKALLDQRGVFSQTAGTHRPRGVARRQASAEPKSEVS